MAKDSQLQSREKKLQQAELLLNVSRQVAAMDTLDDILETLVTITSNELGAERSTIFLNDTQTGELYSRVAQGGIVRRIRMFNNAGIAGHVFTTGESIIVDDAYADERFNREIDQQTGFETRSILCVPIRTVRDEVIGVVQALNKKEGKFSQADRILLEAMVQQAAVALQGAQTIERMKKSRVQELEFLDMVSDITSEIDLRALLQKVMGEATRMLNAERSTLFLNDEKTGELWSEVGEGIESTQIRFPNHLGIAGTVFTSGETVNIPYAYADLRFNPAFDKKTGYFTRSILCVPVVNKSGKVIGVTQVLNKQGGPFTHEDESRLKAFTAQVSIALENANLFNDVQNMKNYNEAMLESMPSGVMTLDEEGRIVTCNAAGLEIMELQLDDILQKNAAEFFAGENSWVLERINRMEETGEHEIAMDAAIYFHGEEHSVNLTIQPLVSGEGRNLGTMLMIDDISSEKRMKSTMSRYMDPGLADQLLAGGDDILGGQNITATVLFSDVRGFTTLSEELGAQGTVSLLNEYFTIMVDCIQRENGMLDKFIGDAIMAGFGVPVAGDDDVDRAVRAAIAMISELQQWNRQRIADGRKPVDMGIGLNTDVVVSGNIGSPKRMDYTMIGDGVNLAARLESACKQYAARILISDNTCSQLKGTYRIRDVDDVVVKGKTEPVRIHEVLDYYSAETFPNLMEVVGNFKEGRLQYRAGNWEKAISFFRKALDCNPDDTLSGIYIDRCEHLKSNPPADEWNGVWVMTSK
jgi:adenylate cyclase